MINATSPAVSNTKLPPPSLDQEGTSIDTATGANTNAAASTQLQAAKPAAEQGISAQEYDANFSTTRDPSSVNNRQMLMINPNSVNPNATRANVQGQMDATTNGSLDNRLATANTTSESAQARTSEASGSMMIAGVSKKSPVVNIQGVGANSQSVSQPDKNNKRVDYSQVDYTFADKKIGGINIPEVYVDGKKVTNFDVPGTLGSQGCTITALTNVLGYSAKEGRLNAPTVPDTNSKNKTFYDVFDKTSFRDLTGKGEKLYRVGDLVLGLGDPVGKMIPIATLKPTSDKKLDATATMLSEPPVLKEVRKSLENGNPVLLGLSKNAEVSTRVTKSEVWSRHTVVANGIDAKGNITVVDSADGKTKTLKEAVETWGDNNIDRAYEVRSTVEKLIPGDGGGDAQNLGPRKGPSRPTGG